MSIAPPSSESVADHLGTFDHGDIPTSDEKDALAGSSGSPGAGNPYEVKLDAAALRTDVAAQIGGAADKASPVAGDLLLLEDSEDAFNKKKVLLSNLPAAVPLSHASTHQHGGSDEVATATPGANAIPKATAGAVLDSWISTITTVVKGLIRLSTQAEVDAGVSTSTAITPSRLAAAAIYLADIIVRKIRTTTGPTDMVVGAVADGQLLKRVGATLVGTPQNDASMAGQEWAFSSVIADADPGAATFRLDNATQASALFIYISDLPTSGVDMGSHIAKVHHGDFVYLQQRGDSTRHHLFRVSADVVDGTGYWKLPVTSSAGGADLQAGEAVNVEIMHGVGARNDYVIGFATDANPYVATTTGAAYATQGAFFFGGTDKLDEIEKIKVVKQANTGSPTHSVRIFDLTNSQIIAEVTGLSSTTLDILDMGTISNLPTAAALLSVQVQRDGGGAVTHNLYSASVEF